MINVSVNKGNETTIRFTSENAPDVILFISYETIVAFQVKYEVFCSENVWSKTTGKFLNKIEPDKKKRLKYEDFQKELEKFEIVIYKKE